MSRVTDTVMQRVSDALDTLAADATRRRTKRALEEIAGLSHDAVARAFRQDSDEPSSWALNERYAALTDNGTNRLAPERREVVELQRAVAERDQRIRGLEEQIAVLSQLNHVQRLAIDALQDPQTATVIPLRAARLQT